MEYIINNVFTYETPCSKVRKDREFLEPDSGHMYEGEYPKEDF